MKWIENRIPEILCPKCWLHFLLRIMIVSGFIFVPIGLNVLVHGSVEEVRAEQEIISEDCSYRVARNGNIHSRTSLHYDRVNYRIGLCYKEALILSSIIK